MERYELLKDIGSGNFGVARLMRNKETKELVAMKYIPRGLKVRRIRAPLFLSASCAILRPRISVVNFFADDGCSVAVILQIDENVAREIINHRSLRHPNIIRFKEVSESTGKWGVNFLSVSCEARKRE